MFRKNLIKLYATNTQQKININNTLFKFRFINSDVILVKKTTAKAT